MNNDPSRRRQWRKLKEERTAEIASDGNYDLSAGAHGAEAEDEAVMISDLTTEEFSNLVTASVERAIEEVLPKFFSHQRRLMEDQLKIYLEDQFQSVHRELAALSAAASDQDPSDKDRFADNQVIAPDKPEINEAIDWSFLE